MTINTQQLIELAVELCRIHELRVTTKECVKGSVIAGLSTFLGGVIFGPIGLAVGGTFGGITASLMSNDFKSVDYIILNELTEAQRARLVNKLRCALNDISITDFTCLIPFVVGNANLNEMALSAVRDFIRNDLSYQLMA